MTNYQVSVDIILQLLNDARVKKRIQDITREMVKGKKASKDLDKAFKDLAVSENKVASATKKLSKQYQTQIQRIRSTEKQLKELLALKSRGVKLDKESANRMKMLSAQYTRLGGNMAKLKAQQMSLLGSFTKFRWLLVNITMAYMLFSRVLGPIFKQQIELETAMANVQKTTGFTNIEIEEMRHQFVELSKDIPIAAKELAEIGVVAGQLGLGQAGTKAMVAFVRAASMLATATSMSAEEAATNLAKISQSFNLHISHAMKLGSVLNELENTTAATATEIAEALKRVGAAGANLALPVEFVAALEATLISAGMKGSRAGTRIRNALNIMGSEAEKVSKLAGMSFQKFSKLIKEDSVEAIKELIKKLHEAKEAGEDINDIMSTFGRVGGFAIQTLVNNYDEFIDNIETANAQMRSGLSLLLETGTMTKTTAGQWELLKNSIAAATIEGGGFFNRLIQGARSFQLIKEHTGQGLLSQWFLGTGLIDDKKMQSIFDEQWKTLRDLGEQAGFTEEDFKLMFERIAEYGKISATLGVGEADRFIAGLTDMVEAEKEISKTRKSAIDDLGGMDSALQKLITANKEVEDAVNVSRDEFMGASMELADLRDRIELAFGSEVLTLLDAYISKMEKVGSVTEETSKAQQRAALVFSITNKAISEQLKELKGDYNALKKVRFEGEKEALENIHAIELAIKKEKLAQMDLTSAIEATNDALGDNKDTYDAWVETVNQFITSAIESGNLLGKNVSNAIKKYQTLLLSTSKFTDKQKKEKTTLEKLEDERTRAQLEYEIGIGEQHYALSEYIKELERENSTVYDSVGIVTDALRDKKYAIDDLVKHQKDITEEWQNAQTAVKLFALDMDTVTFGVLGNIADMKSAALDLIETFKDMGTTTPDTGGGGGGGGGGSAVSEWDFWHDFRSGVSGTLSGINSSDIFDQIRDMYGHHNWFNQVDFTIKKLALGGLITKPTLAMLGEAGPEMVVPLTGPNAGAGAQQITIGEINVTGVTGDASDFAYSFAEELRKELRTL